MNLCWKTSFSIRSEILGLLANTLTAVYEHSRSNMDKLKVPMQMQLTGKLETFSMFFIAFLECALNCEHFQKKVSLMAQVFLSLLTPKDVFTYEHKRSYF